MSSRWNKLGIIHFSTLRCKPGFFNLDLENEFGCMACFCFGHSSQCVSSKQFSTHLISSDFERSVMNVGHSKACLISFVLPGSTIREKEREEEGEGEGERGWGKSRKGKWKQEGREPDDWFNLKMKDSLKRAHFGWEGCYILGMNLISALLHYY